MLQRIDPLRSICRQISYARCYHRPIPPKKPSQNPIKEDRHSIATRYFNKQQKLRELRLAMERVERRQKKLHADMDEVERILEDNRDKEKKAKLAAKDNTKKTT
ncbi:hypothetical protein DOY81_014630 [Sarcophaga bullata]|nr:hypothetical protein DOY81_014630 [Sarcophaga bullata]